MAKLSSKQRNDLPDSSFLLIRPGGEKDEDGKTKPRALRAFPVKDQTGAVLLPQLRNALARIPQALQIAAGVRTRITKLATSLLKRANEGKVPISRATGGAKAVEASLPGEVEGLVLAGGEQIDFAANGHKDAKGRSLFEKDMLRIGSYTHPSKGWTLNVDRQYMDRLAHNFRQMKSMGIGVPVTQDHSKKAKDACGELVDVFVRGNRLIGVHAIDEGAEELTTKSGIGTSVEINRNYVTTGRHRLGPALTANSIVQHPVVNHQHDFVKVAASRESGESVDIDAAVLLLSEADEPSNEPGASKMKALIKFLNEKFELSIDDDADEAAVLSAVEGLQASLVATAEEAKKADEAKDTTIKTLEASLADAKPATIEMSATELLLSTDALDMRLASLVEKGKITPAVSKALKPQLQTALMLSVTEGDEPKPRYREVLDALSLNDIVVLGEKTDSQTLSRVVPDAAETVTTEADPKVVAGFFPGGKTPSQKKAEAAAAAGA